jgi:hypothetical protein
MTRCPFCKEEIQEGAIKCKHCFEFLRRGEDAGLSDYYRQTFTVFDQRGGGFKVKWNWAAFLSGALWYLAKGIWIKGLLMLVFIFVFAGVPAPLFWVYAGIAGNWDYYLLKVKGKHFW